MSASGTPNYVQVPVDSTGKRVETEDVVQADGTLIERQRVAAVPSLTDLSIRAAAEISTLCQRDTVMQALAANSRGRFAFATDRGGR